MTAVGQLNRVVWMLWLQGFHKAPDVVRLCLHSWKTRNPGWQIIALDDGTLSEHIDSESLSILRGLDIKRQKLANLVRLHLISRHGGVWVDSTCFCCRPLDDWLHDYMDSGFFAFRDPGPDRVLANWFLASTKGNLLPSTFYELHREFFQKNSFPLQHTKEARTRIARLKPILMRNSRVAQLWTSPFVIKAVKAYPYFIFHYHFARMLRENKACRDIWERMPYLDAEGAKAMVRPGLLSPMPSELIEDLNHPKHPVFKLTHHFRQEDVKEGCILDYIMRSMEGWNPQESGMGGVT